jgi:hypothetical protein
MYTSVDLEMLRAVDNGAVLPGIDTSTGNQDPAGSLSQLSQLPILASLPYYYDAAHNLVRVTQNGAVLNGINFGGATVEILANNVTIENCTLAASTGYDSVIQGVGYSGATIKNCTFTSLGETNLKLEAYIESRGNITVQNNTFLDAPGDAIDISAGTVSGNYFSGAGYSPTHSDAIWVSATTGPVLISNNFIDWTANPADVSSPNDCIRITAEMGSVSNVTVTGNYLIGGSSVIDAGNTGTDGTFSNINISNNYIGFGVCWDFYPGPQTGVTETGNVIFDFTNPIYSANAWTAYQASGIVTNALVIAQPGATSITANATGSTTLYGAGLNVRLMGGSGLTIFVGGAGTQDMYGGKGKNVFTYLSVADSPVTEPDLLGFNVATDVIDLHAINANPASATTVNFTFIGSAAFSNAGGEVRVVQNVANNTTLVEADLVGDMSADLEIRLGGLQNLTAANFALTNAQYAADIAAYTTMASFLASQSSLDQVAGGYSIVDSGANILANLAALEADAGNINAVTPTDGVASVNVATFVADQTVLNKFAGGFAVVDTGANIQAQIDAMEQDAGAITSVTMSDTKAASPVVLSLSTAEAANDAAILAKIAAPYVLDVNSASGATVTGHGSGLTIDIGAGGGVSGPTGTTTTITGGGKGDTFYFSANFGAAQITDFEPYVNGATPDTISLSTTDFANWSTLLADGHASGNTTTFVAADGANLTLVGVPLYNMQHFSAAQQAEFQFHA